MLPDFFTLLEISAKIITVKYAINPEMIQLITIDSPAKLAAIPDKVNMPEPIRLPIPIIIKSTIVSVLFELFTIYFKALGSAVDLFYNSSS